ncbi:MAG: hypothetical protein MZV63_31205 [Marinilabiliales bacterium]|nr:hypothetical protein [Marinilabiliales bacterium]
MFSMFRGSSHDRRMNHAEPDGATCHVCLCGEPEREVKEPDTTRPGMNISARSSLSPSAASTQRQMPSVTRLDTGRSSRPWHACWQDNTRNYCFYSDEFCFYRPQVLCHEKRTTEIIAGVSAIPARVQGCKCTRCLGLADDESISCHTPSSEDCSSLSKFRYLMLEAIYCRKGNEDHLPDLFEAVCAEEGISYGSDMA